MAEDLEEQKPTPAPSKFPTNWKKAVLTLLLVVAFLAVGGGSFWLGLKKTSAPQVGESAVRTEVPAEEATAESEIIPTIILTPTVTPKPTGALTPTPTSTPTPTPTPTPTTKTFDSSASIDGFRSSNGGGNTSLDVRVGRNVNLVTRGFVSFGTAALPVGATIETATLRLYQAKIIGNPYGVGIRVMVDHLDYGDSLENADYSASSISGSFATLSSNANLEWKEVDVTDAVRNDRENNRERSQFRIHFAVENQGGTVTGDFAYFESANNSEGTGNTPQLVIRYH